jgi:hypothetical protein
LTGRRVIVLGGLAGIMAALDRAEAEPETLG